MQEATAPSIRGFEVLECLGSGAMSAVWKARAEASGEFVALKILHPHVALSPSAVDRFVVEVRAYRRLDHPNIIACVGQGAEEGATYIALELLDGGDLRQFLLASGRLPAETAAFAASEVLRALAHAHEAGVYHRDVKPENVIVARDGRVKLADFGIAAVSDGLGRVGTAGPAGTPAYLAPELLAGAPPDARSDLWSVGVLLYEMISGANPFAAVTLEGTAARVRSWSPAPLGYRIAGVPLDLEAVVERLLLRSPDERVPSAREAIDLLAPILIRSPDWASRGGLLAVREESRSALKRWAEERGDGRLRVARGLLREVVPRHEAALLEASEALALDPTRAEAEALVAALSAPLRRPDEATAERIGALERTAEGSPSNVLALVELVRVARAAGDVLLAARAYRWARRRSGGDRFTFARLAPALGFELAAHIEGLAPDLLRARLQGGGGAPGSSRAGDLGASLLSSRLVWLALAAFALLALTLRFAADGGEGSSLVAGRAKPPQPPRAIASPLFRASPDLGLLALEQATHIEQSGDRERALAILDVLIAEHPGHAAVPEALMRSALLCETLDRDHAAMVRYEELLRRFPTTAEEGNARRGLARVSARRGDLPRALELLDGLRDEGDFETRVTTEIDRGAVLEAMGEEALAIAAYTPLMKVALPDYLGARTCLGLGRVLQLRGDAEAWFLFNEAVRRAPPESATRRAAEAALTTLDARDGEEGALGPASRPRDPDTGVPDETPE